MKIKSQNTTKMKLIIFTLYTKCDETLCSYLEAQNANSLMTWMTSLKRIFDVNV